MPLLKILKLTLVAAALGFYSENAMAQGAYVKLGGGYNFGLGGSIQYDAKTIINYSSNAPQVISTRFDRVDINYGKGVSFQGGFGYMFNKNLGAEITICSLKGAENELKDIYRTENGEGAGSNLPYRFRAHSKMIVIQPVFILSAGMGKVNPYTKFGAIMAKGTVFQTNLFANQGGAILQESELSGGLALGFLGGLGADFKVLNDKTAIFAEATFTNLQYSPDKSKLTRYTINNKDQLSSLPTRLKELEFKDNFKTNNTGLQSDSSPTQAQRFYLPFNSVGFQIGLKYNF